MRQLRKPALALSTLFLAGCLGGNKTAVTFDGLQMEIPAEYVSVSSAQLDNFQIINKILKAYKIENQTLIIARSALTTNANPQEYATASKEKLAQAVPGYEHIDDGSHRFTCGDDTIQGYTHSFAVADSS